MASYIAPFVASLYEGLRIISREPIGFLPSVSRNNSMARLAVGEQLKIPVYKTEASTNIVAAVTPPDDGDTTVSHIYAEIEHSKRVPIRINGNEEEKLNKTIGADAVISQRFAQGFRTLINEMEQSIARKIIGAGAAVGVAGSTPFGSNFDELADARQVLSDVGAPTSDLRLVLNSSAATNLRKLAHLTQVNTSGTDSTLRQGELLPLDGFRIFETSQGSSMTHANTSSSTPSAWETIVAPVAGSKELFLASGTGDFVAGDAVTIGLNTDIHIVESFDVTTQVMTLTHTIPSTAQVNEKVALVGDYKANFAFDANALHFASRLPEMYSRGDLATDRYTIQDPFSGIYFEIAVYPQYKQMQFEISASWGSKLVQPEHSLLILG